MKAAGREQDPVCDEDYGGEKEKEEPVVKLKSFKRESELVRAVNLL